VETGSETKFHRARGALPRELYADTARCIEHAEVNARSEGHPVNGEGMAPGMTPLQPPLTGLRSRKSIRERALHGHQPRGWAESWFGTYGYVLYLKTYQTNVMVCAATRCQRPTTVDPSARASRSAGTGGGSSGQGAMSGVVVTDNMRG